MAKARYCYLEPEYPQRVIMVMAYIEDSKKHIFYPMDLVYKNKSEAVAQVKLIHENLSRKGVTVDAAVLYELKLSQKINLTQDCWEGENKEKNGYWRYKRYITMMGQPGLYEILILPRNWDAKRKIWQLAVSIPFYRGGEIGFIEQFIKYSRDVVDIRAKSCATYTLEKSYRFSREDNELKQAEMLMEPNSEVN
ncbi:MAG: hypothetical protein WCT01_01305 [Candidatus Shapirobacteria bacterium]